MSCCPDACVIDGGSFDLPAIMKMVREKLLEQGIDFETACETGAASEQPKVKVVCVTPCLQDSVREMGGATRDQVVMVRVDRETAGHLDAWLATGAVKSRSEAAALFIREGLKVHTRELDELEEALQGVEAAKDRLKKKAREVFEPSGGETENDAE